MSERWRTKMFELCLLGVILVVCMASSLACGETSPDYIAYSGQDSFLSDGKIDESSGLAASRRTPGVYWTHNDSGGKPRIFAFGTDGPGGKDLGRVDIEGADAVDWEDMAAFDLDGEHWLLLADTGDNDGKRKTLRLYIVPEPLPPGEPKLKSGGKKPSRRKSRKSSQRVRAIIDFSWPQGHRYDCEAVAVDAKNRKIYLATKHKSLRCDFFTLDLPAPGVLTGKAGDSATASDSREILSVRAEASFAAATELMMVTAMDISPDSSRMALMSYTGALEYVRPEDVSWPELLKSAVPFRLPLPSLRQPEAICYGPKGKTISVTSEKTPTPFITIKRKELGVGRELK